MKYTQDINLEPYRKGDLVKIRPVTFGRKYSGWKYAEQYTDEVYIVREQEGSEGYVTIGCTSNDKTVVTCHYTELILYKSVDLADDTFIKESSYGFSPNESSMTNHYLIKDKHLDIMARCYTSKTMRGDVLADLVLDAIKKYHEKAN